MTSYAFSWIATYITPYQKAPKACLSFRFRKFNPDEMTTYGFSWIAKYISFNAATAQSNVRSLNKGSKRCLALRNNSQATKRTFRRMTKGKVSYITIQRERTLCLHSDQNINQRGERPVDLHFVNVATSLYKGANAHLHSDIYIYINQRSERSVE